MYNRFLSCVLKEIRLNMNFTQKQIAIIIGKSEISIRKYESGSIPIPFSVLFLYLKMFNINLNYLNQILKTIDEKTSGDDEDEYCLTPREFIECLDRFNKDIAKIYGLNENNFNLLRFDSIDELKFELENKIQEYILNFIATKIKEVPTNKKENELILLLKNEIMNYIDFRTLQIIKLNQLKKHSNKP